MKKKIAFITGITGQDGSYLAELLLEKNYIVHGLLRRTSVLNIDRIQSIIDKHEKSGQLNLHYMDLTDTSSISNLIIKYKPKEFYNLAAMSHVGISFSTGEATLNINTLASYRILESILKNHKSCKFYQASSSEMFGSTPPPQNEKSNFNPQSPYGISKVSAFYTTRYFRQAHGLFAANGILFNHESPRRGLNFVTRKITHSLARILSGHEKKIFLGDISTRRDWGHSKDYVRGIWLILQHKKPEDFVLSTGKNYSIEDFLKKVFKILNLDWKKFVVTNNKNFMRPSEVRSLQGDSTKARKLLKWKPKYDLDALCKDMLISDLELYGMSLDQAKNIAKKLSKK
jgi:GDPmannose 4,6-dehydratase|tara:strand:- start:1551 stop:2579 length:1029 start_codon:yes stop_codon:yes gene_type:complete